MRLKFNMTGVCIRRGSKLEIHGEEFLGESSKVQSRRDHRIINQLGQHLGVGFLAFRTVGKLISVVQATE